MPIQFNSIFASTQFNPTNLAYFDRYDIGLEFYVIVVQFDGFFIDISPILASYIKL